MKKKKSKSKSKGSKPKAKRSYENDRIATGEAVRLKPGEELPDDATHEIVEQTNDKVTLKRHRYYLVEGE